MRAGDDLTGECDARTRVRRTVAHNVPGPYTPGVTDGAGGRPSTATVLFTDLAGSTDLRRALGDDQADELRRRHDETITAAAAEHLGEVVKGTGDGLMVVFPAAAQAVAGAVAVQRAIHRLNRTLPAPLAVRVGLSAGDVAWEGSDCFGTPVVEAARLCNAAREGQILASEVVRLLAGSRGTHRLEPVGTLDLKGLGEINAYEVGWDAGPDAAAPLPGALAPHETLPLIGRVDERDALREAWKRTLAGTPHVVLIAGEPGVGKTRLAAELGRGVHADGANVLFGRCDEALGVPYQPFAEATATYAAGCADDVLLAELGTCGGELARLVPALRARFPGLPEPIRADAETERFRLFEAVTGFLTALSTSSPTVLILDDLHWAARPTLLLLRHVIRQRSAGRLLIVGTYRDTDLGRGHPLSEILADLRREPDVERIVLHGLAEEEVVELVATAAGHELDAATTRFACDIHAETEGNPFFVGQVLRHMVETGAVQNEAGRWVVDRRRAGGIPEGVREVIGKRLSQLGPDANEVLSVAAVIGREFDNRLLTDASGLEAERVLDALEEAEATRLILPLAGREGRRTFAHALVRSTLYQEIATTRRLRIHRRVAQALEQRASRGVPCLEELAHHSCESAALGDIDAALRWTRAAAQAAMTRLAYEEAASQFERALGVLDPDEPEHLAALASMRVGLATALRAAGSNAASRETALAAAAEARAAGRPDILLDAALVIAGDRGWSEAGLVDHALVELLEHGLATIEPGDSPLRAMALARLASELYFLEAESERREALTAEAVSMAERCGDTEAKAFVLGCALWGGWVPGNAAERVARGREILELGRSAGNLVHELTGTMWMLNSSIELGDSEQFRRCLAREVEIAQQLRRPEWLWAAGVHRGAEALMRASFEEAAELIEEAFQIGQQLASETVMQMYGVGQFALARARGGLEPLVPLLQAMVEQFPLIPAWRCGLAFLYRELGLAAEAREQFDHFAADGFRAIPLDANWKVGISILASVAAMTHDADHAEQLYDLLLPHADTMIIAGMPADLLGFVHGPLVLLAATLGRWDDAEAHHLAGRAANQRTGCRSWFVYSELEWARLLAGRGDAGDAARVRTILEPCARDAERYGMPRVVAMAETLLADAS